MEVILLQKIENLGDLGEKVKVKPGYARNHLIPKSLAKYATEENLKEFEEEKLDGFELKLSVEANEEGMLFGSIGPDEIEKHLLEDGKEISRKEIRMPDGPIKKIGEYPVIIHLGTDTDATINLIVETNNQS